MFVPYKYPVRSMHQGQRETQKNERTEGDFGGQKQREKEGGEKITLQREGKTKKRRRNQGRNRERNVKKKRVKC